MQQHLPRQFAGPLRGAPAWWDGLDPQLRDAEADTSRNKRKRNSSPTGEPQVRQGLVDRVRKEIEAGTYDSPEKWEAALDRLLDRLAED